MENLIVVKTGNKVWQIAYRTSQRDIEVGHYKLYPEKFKDWVDVEQEVLKRRKQAEALANAQF